MTAERVAAGRVEEARLEDARAIDARATVPVWERALAATLGRRPGAIVTPVPGEPEPRRASVAVVLSQPAGDAGDGGVLPSVLFVKRAEYPGDPWSGHVAFPGGRAEPVDATPWDTAVREAYEETGLDLRANARLVGTLDELHPRMATLPSIVVRPHVVAIGAPGPLHLSAELVAAFWVPITALTSPDVDRPSTVATRTGRLTVPSFVWAGHTIWGMTERILRDLLQRMG